MKTPLKTPLAISLARHWCSLLAAVGLLLVGGAKTALAQQASLTISCGIVGTCNATDTEWSLTKALAAQDTGSAGFTVTAEKVSVSGVTITVSAISS
jgi:hypothetical protein